MRRKSPGLWVMLVFGFITLLAANVYGIEEMTGTDTSGQWSVYVRAEEGVCGQDRNGINIRCTKFEYEIRTHPPGVFPNQANIRIPICPPGSGFSIVDPTDRSVKIRDCDPNSGFVCDDLFADAITWDSLKDTPNVQTDFSVAVTPASIEETTLALVTEFGNILVPTLGPGCCSEVQRISEVTYTLPESSGWLFAGGSEGSVRASFNVCSGDQTGDVVDAVTGVPYTEIPGGYFCTGSLDSYDKRTCTKGNKFGPVTGALLYTEGFVYFGWGSRIYKGPIVTDFPDDGVPVCDPDATGNAPFPRIRTYAGVIALEQDACGNLLRGEHLVTGEVIYPEAAYSWFCEASAIGRNSGVCSRIVTANIDDAIGDGSCRIWSGGRWLYFAGSCP